MLSPIQEILLAVRSAFAEHQGGTDDGSDTNRTAETTSQFSLPADLVSSLESFSAKTIELRHEDSRLLHQGLFDIYRHHVAPTGADPDQPDPPASSADHFEIAPDRRDAWATVISSVAPCMLDLENILFWWIEFLLPAADGSELRSLVIAQAVRKFANSILFPPSSPAAADRSEEHDKAKTSFWHHLITAYVDRARKPPSETSTCFSSERSLLRDIEITIAQYAERQPKDFFYRIDDILVRSNTRPQALQLLCAFLEVQTDGLSIILETPILNHLLTSLLTDMSGVVVTMALSAVVVIITHVPEGLVPLLPTLFLIYNRIVCWDLYLQDAVDDEAESGNPGEAEQPAPDSDQPTQQVWQTTGLGFDGNQTVTPKANVYFTVLYGLFPVCLSSFIRKPRRFLKDCNFPAARDVELKQAPMASRSVEFQSAHRLHPNFLSLSMEEEMENFKFRKWEGSLLVECMRYCIKGSHIGDFDFPEFLTENEHQDELRAPEDSEAAKDEDTEEPKVVVDPETPFTEEPRQLSNQDLTDGASSSSQGISELKLEDLKLLTASVKPSESPSIEALQRVVMILDAELKFERLLRQEHVTSLMAAEKAVHNLNLNYEEAHTLIQSNKFLRQRLEFQTTEYNKLQYDIVHRSDSRKAWAEQLEKQVRQAIDRERQALAKEKALSVELEWSKEEAAKYRNLFEELQSDRLLTQDMVTELDEKMQEIPLLQEETKEAREKLAEFEKVKTELAATQEECLHLRATLDLIGKQSRPQDEEKEQMEVSLPQALLTKGASTPATGTSTPRNEGSSSRRSSVPPTRRKPVSLEKLMGSLLESKNQEVDEISQKYEKARAAAAEAERKCLHFEALYQEAQEVAEQERKRADELRGSKPEAADFQRLHGGPGLPLMSASSSFFNPLDWTDSSSPAIAQQMSTPIDSAQRGSHISPELSSALNSTTGGPSRLTLRQPSFMERMLRAGSHRVSPGSNSASPLTSIISTANADNSPSSALDGFSSPNMAPSSYPSHHQLARSRLVSKSSGLSTGSTGTSAAPVTLVSPTFASGSFSFAQFPTGGSQGASKEPSVPNLNPSHSPTDIVFAESDVGHGRVRPMASTQSLPGPDPRLEGQRPVAGVHKMPARSSMQTIGRPTGTEPDSGLEQPSLSDGPREEGDGKGKGAAHPLGLTYFRR